MMWRQRYVSLVMVALVSLQFLSVFTNTYQASAEAGGTSTALKPERGDSKEYYYFDKNDIYGAGGRYAEPVKFIKKYGDTVYVPDGTTMKIDKIKEDADKCESDTVPTRLWNKNKEQSGKEPAFFLNLVLKGSAELDLKSDREDGIFRWGNLSDEFKKKAADAPDSINDGTVAKDDVRFQGIDGGSVYAADSDFSCTYRYFKHFQRLVAPYDDDTLDLGPLAGKIMGRQGMPFDEYTKRGDNRLAFRAYSQTAREKILEHCNRQGEIYKCINNTNQEFLRCYGVAIGASGANLEADAARVEADSWTKQFKSEDFVKCFENASSLAGNNNFFKDGDELKTFAQSIVDSVILPPSLKPDKPDEPGKLEADSETQCSIGMLGWILCPVFSFIATINDQVFNILKNWLVLAPFQQDVGGSNAAAYDVWSKIRNIVNGLFIIFFLILLYAQVTGRGLDTYGVRALLPRIIIGALLVNLSYIICSVAVDLSNSLGDSIYRLLNGTTIQGATVGSGVLDGGWENVTASIILGGGAIAGTLLLIANLSALVPIMVMAFVALVTTFLVLLFRQALVIIFVAAAPIAFLLFVLPSTASWFAKWRTIFIQLLLLYPAFALIFSGSQIAAEIVRDTAAANEDTLLTIFSLGIQVIPLFLLPLIMKLGGGVLNRFGGIINNPNKGPFDSMRKRADEFRQNRKTKQQTRALNGRAGAFGYGTLIRMNNRRKTKQLYHAANANRAKNAYTAKNQASVIRSALGSSAGKDLKDQMRDVLGESINKELREEYEAARTLIENSDMSMNMSPDELQQAYKDMAMAGRDNSHVSPGDQAASMEKVVQNGNIDDIDEMLDAVHHEQGQLTDLQREVIMKASSSLGGGAAHLTAANIDQTLNNIKDGGLPPGQTLSQALYANAATRGAYSPEAMAAQDEGAIRGLIKAGSGDNPAISASQMGAIRQSFAAAKNDPKLNNRMTDATRRAGNNL